MDIHRGVLDPGLLLDGGLAQGHHLDAIDHQDVIDIPDTKPQGTQYKLF